MPPLVIEALGMVAGTLTTIAFLPQLLSVWRKKSAADLSYGYLLLFTSGVILWLAYGILIQRWPVIVANGLTLAFISGILALKAHYERER